MGRSQRPLPSSLGKKLRQIRDSLGFTLEQMIEHLGYKTSPIYPTNISAMERGEREPPLPLLLAYARLIGISTDVLIDDDMALPQNLSICGTYAMDKKSLTNLGKHHQHRKEK